MPIYRFLIEFGEAAEEAVEDQKEFERRQKSNSKSKPRYSKGRRRHWR